jgi:hypothetical protein
MGSIATHAEEIQRTIRTYCKTLCSTKLEHLKETDNFLDRYHLPKLNQNQINDLNRLITPDKIEAVIKSLRTTTITTTPDSDGFSTEFCQNFKEDLTLILLKLLHRIETEGTLNNSFYVITVILIPKSHKDSTKKRTTDQFSL